MFPTLLHVVLSEALAAESDCFECLMPRFNPKGLHRNQKVHPTPAWKANCGLKREVRKYKIDSGDLMVLDIDVETEGPFFGKLAQLFRGARQSWCWVPISGS